MTSITRSQLETLLTEFIDPYLQTDWLDAGVVKDIEIRDKIVRIQLKFGYPVGHLKQGLIAKLQQQLTAIDPKLMLQVDCTWQVQPHAVQPNVSANPQIKNVIAVASGKGGVGKSTTSVNLATALAAEGARVGLLDADIYGPNQPQMLGIGDKPPVQQAKGLVPVISHGIQTMSIGYLIDKETPMVWRGPMASKALQQLVRDTMWDDLDYLIVDLPPGTGDIQLTLAQRVPISAAIIVTTPQEVALLDARKAIAMFNKVKVKTLGIVENMSWHVCGHCGEREYIFGEAGAAQLAAEFKTEVLGQLPLARTIREHADTGRPIAAERGHDISQLYLSIARRIAAKLSLQPKNYAAKFPKIVVE